MECVGQTPPQVWQKAQSPVRAIFERGAGLERRVAHRALDLALHDLAGKVVGLVFEKPSLRTRVSFEAGMIRFLILPVTAQFPSESTLPWSPVQNHPSANTAAVSSGMRLSKVAARKKSKAEAMEIGK